MTVARNVQGSLIEGMERPVGPILPSVFTGTNADLMAAVAPLYLTGSVLDVTYGEGKWWDRFTPDPFTFHDLYKVDGVDFRQLPEDDSSVDTVCFDPAYIPQGGTDTASGHNFHDRFGLEQRGEGDFYAMNAQGLAECARVARRFVLVKCCDFVNGGRFQLGHLFMLDTGRALELEVHDLIVHHTGSGPGGHNIFNVKRARRHHSYLLVFTPAKSVHERPTVDVELPA